MEEGKDYYFNSRGLMVFTEEYHLKRGYCCGNGCLHCPYTKEAGKQVPAPEKGEKESGERDAFLE